MFKSLGNITTDMVLMSLFVSSCASATESDTVSLRQVLANNPNVNVLLPIGSNITMLQTKGNGLFNTSGQLINNEFVKEVPILCKTEWQIMSPVVDLMSDKVRNEWRAVSSTEISKEPSIIQRHTAVSPQGKDFQIFGSRCKDTFEWNSQFILVQGVKYQSQSVYINHKSPQDYVIKADALKAPVEPADGVVPSEHFGKNYPNYIEMISWAATLCERKNGQLSTYPIGSYRANQVRSLDEMTTQWLDEYFVGCTTPNTNEGFLVKVFIQDKDQPWHKKVVAFQRGRTLESVLSGK